MKRKMTWLMALVLVLCMYTVALGEPAVSVGEMTLTDDPSTMPSTLAPESGPDDTGTPPAADRNEAPADETGQPAPTAEVMPTPIPEVEPTATEEVAPSPIPEVEPGPTEEADPDSAEEAEPDSIAPIAPVPIEEADPDAAGDADPDPIAEVAPLEPTDCYAEIDYRLEDPESDPPVAVLSCILVGIDVSDVQLQWQVDDGSGWTDIPGEAGIEYRVEVTPQAIASQWRVKVIVVGA